MILDSPYPTTDGIKNDSLSLQIISPAYATSVGELNAILQYVYHSFCFYKHGLKDYAETLMGIAKAEMIHLDILGKTIFALGAAPVFAQYPLTGFNFYSAKYVSYSNTLKNMLEDDLIGERRAIADYNKMLKCLKNRQVSDIIARIVEDEKLHVSALEEILKEFKC
ncbi:MAG: hypothetical protein K2L67_01255 [Clostridia bacterium]|nr:hypothetical protein [Clostridia bacterium]